jgi:hypothetical protein
VAVADRQPDADLVEVEHRASSAVRPLVAVHPALDAAAVLTDEVGAVARDERDVVERAGRAADA